MTTLLLPLFPSRPAARPSVALGEGWVRPHWLERAGGQAVAVPTNEDQRRWTVIGSVDSPHQARVDVRGLVQLDGRAWSLDWWIGAEARSEEHTSELQSLMRNVYAGLWWEQKTTRKE